MPKDFDSIPGNKKDPCTCSHLRGEHYFNMDDAVVCGRCAFPRKGERYHAQHEEPPQSYYLHSFTLDNFKYIEIQRAQKKIETKRIR